MNCRSSARTYCAESPPPGHGTALALIGRDFLEIYLKLPNYTNNLLWLGFDENDFRNGGSDQLIDAIIAWGDLNAIRNRIREHHSAGADHVCVQVLTADPHALPLREWRELASAVL